MGAETSLASLLNTLTSSIESASNVIATEESLLPPENGISLLDVKNELLLSYLQNLVFLILLKLRTRTRPSPTSEESQSDITEDVVKKLCELRLYLEKGVRPLETRLKYQIDKVVRAADDATRTAAQNPGDHGLSARSANKPVKRTDSNSDVSDSGSDGSAQSDLEADEMTFGPNISAFARPKAAAPSKAKESGAKDSIYRPPRIHPTALPTTQGREEKGSRRIEKSATMDEFIATELSGAPVAEPSIGSTIVAGGRRMKSQKERQEEAERRDYEETNFVRLPKESKKDQAKKRGQRDGGWGGEEWRNLDVGLDRIDRLTQKKRGASNSLAKSRKRAIEDGPRGTGAQVGEMFEKRRKVVSGYRK